MSAQNATQQLPDVQTAEEVAMQILHRGFFDKLASYGIQPSTEQQAAWILQLSDRLMEVERLDSVKQANDQADPFYQALQGLDAALSETGLLHQVSPRQQTEQLAYKQAGEYWAQHPEIYNSVLVLKSNEAVREAQRQQQLRPAG